MLMCCTSYEKTARGEEEEVDGAQPIECLLAR